MAPFKRHITFLIITLLLACSQVSAQSYLSTVSLYDVSAKDYVSVEDLMGDHGLVLVFIGSYCPYMDFYEGRIEKLQQEYRPQGVNFAFVNSNNTVGLKTETVEHMRQLSIITKTRVISDQGHEIMDAFEVNKIPEVVVIRRKNGELNKTYQGAIDDSPKSESMVKKDYLRLVLNNIIVNKPSPVKNNRPAGCLIK